MQRNDGRMPDQIRSIKFTPNFIEYAAGSVLIELGKTKVLCAVSLNSGVPPFLKGQGTGWLTAEYAMLPAATHQRTQRDANVTKRPGRTVEISRLIGRVFRSAVSLDVIGERTVTIDCDVIQADGGTRTAAIIGVSYALNLAQAAWQREGWLKSNFVTAEVAAISVGIVQNQIVLDLDCFEDNQAQVDFNFILTRAGQLIEVQGTAEQSPIDWADFEQMRAIAQLGIQQIFSYF